VLSKVLIESKGGALSAQKKGEDNTAKVAAKQVKLFKRYPFLHLFESACLQIEKI
jgi:hypothetical protein